MLVRDYLQKTKIEYASGEGSCLPDCATWGFHLDDVTYNEPIEPHQATDFKINSNYLVFMILVEILKQ